MRVFLTTTFALVAFAFNSILCRLALGENAIDASSFTSIRLLSGAAVLYLLFSFSNKKRDNGAGFGNWTSAFFLFSYALCFSFAYTGLTTATGALILFGMVQATMIASAIVAGKNPKAFEWIGLIVAMSGLVYLIFPGLESPPFAGSVLMAAAGVSWGFYTLRGRNSENPLAETAGNFVRTIPFLIPAAVPFVYSAKLTPSGILLAVISGAVASGIGYAVWYTALKYHTATRAAILQLSVPLIAAAGGVLIVAETISYRLPIAAVLILGGIGITIFAKNGRNLPDPGDS